jgi:homoaconitate hydratase
MRPCGFNRGFPNSLPGIFPIDDKLISWYRAKATVAAMMDGPRPSTMFTPTSDRINHARIDELEQNKIEADPNAVYAKKLYMNL